MEEVEVEKRMLRAFVFGSDLIFDQGGESFGRYAV